MSLCAKKLVSALCLFTLCGLIILAGCAGNTPSTPLTSSQANTTALQVGIGDAAADWVASFQVTVNSIVLTSDSGRTESLLASPMRVELTHLAGTIMPLAVTRVPHGAYTRAAITLSSPQVSVINPATGQAELKNPQLGSSTISLNFNPPMVAGAGPMALNFDLPVGECISADTSGGLIFSPKMSMQAALIPSNSGQQGPFNGHMEHVFGKVTLVSGARFSITSGFSQNTLEFNTDSKTEFMGVSGTGMLKSGMVVVVHSVMQADGTPLATKVGVMQMAADAMQAQGIVNSVTGTPVTQFQFLMHNGIGGGMMPQATGGRMTVEVPGDTAFRVHADGVDLSGLPFTPVFDRSSFGVGQRVSVDTDMAPRMMTAMHGMMSPGMVPDLATVTARQVLLQQQVLVGTVSAYSGSTFTLTLSPDAAFRVLTGQSSVSVFKQPGTQLLPPLTAFANGDRIAVRGLLFRDAGAYAMVAARLMSGSTTQPSAAAATTATLAYSAVATVQENTTEQAATQAASVVGPTAVSATPFRFVSWADTKTATSVLASLSNQMVPLNPVLTIYPGDLENAGFTTSGMSAWKSAINGNTNNGIFDKTLPSRGNHDSSNTSGWQSYFDMAATAQRVGATNFSSFTTDLTFSYDYGNSHFVAIDVVGDASLINSAQVAWLDSDLAAAEARGLTHAFIYFHGPIYCMDGHCSYTTRVAPTPTSIANLINVLNRHPIVSATFHGHEHVNAYIHIDNTRIPEVTRPFEQFITGDAGAGPSSCSKTYRFDYCLAAHGFATIDVSGSQFTVSFYRQGVSTPQRTWTFNKGETPPPSSDTTAPAVSITAPANGATVSSTVTVQATASDDVAVSRVEFYVDGALAGSDTSAPFSYAWSTTSYANGAHALLAKALDAAGNNSSSQVSVTVSNTSTGGDTSPPTPSFIAPTNGATVSGTLTVQVAAPDNVGATRVEFYLDGVLKSIDTSTSSFTWGWNTTTTPNGTHTLMTKALDAAKNVGAAQITVTVANGGTGDTTAPTVAITSPAIGATVSNTVTVQATASDSVGVSKVEFYVDGALKATDTSSPYSFAWSTIGVANGAHTLSAKAYDAAGNASSSQVSVNLSNSVADSTAPTVAITSPAHGATVSSTVTVQATASDSVGVSKVEFYVDGALMATDTSSPFTYAWATTNYSNAGHTLLAKAYDAAGNSAASQVAVSVSNSSGSGDTTPPTASFLVPTHGATVSGTIMVQVGASDNVGATRVEFYLDGVLKSIDTTTSSFAWGWNTTTTPNGTHTLSTKALDAAKNVGTAQITVTVANGGTNTDTTPPTVFISSPANGTTVSGTVNIQAVASDNLGVSRVEFYMDGYLAATDTSSPFSYGCNTPAYPNGTHAVMAKAYDAAGNSASSQIVLTLANGLPPADTTPPTVSFAAPANGATVSGVVAVQVSASDNVGVSRVDFYMDGALTASDTSAPFTWNWDSAGAANGAHTVSARAFDPAGNNTMAQVSVNVSNTATAPVNLRPYTATSPWNTPIGTPHISPNNAAYLSGLTGSFGSDPNQYTFPVYMVTSSTPMVKVVLSGVYRDWTCNTCVGAYTKAATVWVPMPAGASQAWGSDAQIVLWNSTTGDEWAFWMAAPQSDGTWIATNGYHYNTKWSAVPASPGPRGAGIPYLAGLIRPWEIAQGRIDHAIAFSYQNTATTFVWPATGTDGKCTLASCMPEGTRLQLDPSLTDADFTAWGLTETGKIIARALQTYGIIVTDTGGHPKVYAEYNTTANWGTTLTASTVSKIPLTKFRVLDPAYRIGSAE